MALLKYKNHWYGPVVRQLISVSVFEKDSAFKYFSFVLWTLPCIWIELYTCAKAGEIAQNTSLTRFNFQAISGSVLAISRRERLKWISRASLGLKNALPLFLGRMQSNYTRTVNGKGCFLDIHEIIKVSAALAPDDWTPWNVNFCMASFPLRRHPITIFKFRHTLFCCFN